MARIQKKAQAGDFIRVKIDEHKKCSPCVVESLGSNSSGRLVYLTTCSCGKKLRLTSAQIEGVQNEDR